MAKGKTPRFPWEIQVAVWRRLAKRENVNAIAAALEGTEFPVSESTIRRWGKSLSDLPNSTILQLPDDLQLFWEEVTGRRVPTIPRATADGIVEEGAFDELAIFADLMVKRLDPPPLPNEAVKETRVPALWSGSSAGSLNENPITDAAALRVEADWPASRCDIRNHPLFAELQACLGINHQAFVALAGVQAVYETYRATSIQSLDFLCSDLLPKAGWFTAQECSLLGEVLLMDAFHHSTTGGGFEFKPEVVELPNDRATTISGRQWTLQMASSSIRRPTPDELMDVAAAWPRLVDDAHASAIFKLLGGTWERVQLSIKDFRTAMPSRSQLEKRW